MRPVITGVRYFLAHCRGLVRHGSKPAREISRNPALLGEISAHLRTHAESIGYAPNRVFLGSMHPDELRLVPRPWYNHNEAAERRQPHGEVMPEEEFYGILKLSDDFDLLWLEKGFLAEVRKALSQHPLIDASELDRLGDGTTAAAIEEQIADAAKALPLHLWDGSLVGCVNRAHEEDDALTAPVILENLACKGSAAMALRTLLHDGQLDPGGIDYVINCGEEAVGERYQRGGGNLAKAIGEMCGLGNATGSDLKAFCCGPVHALVMAASLVSAGVFQRVAVVAGCSLAKLGMKFQSHLGAQQPIIEDTLAAVAILVEQDDGVNPVLRLDSIGRHTIGAGSSQQAIFEKLIAEPLGRCGLRFEQIDKYATELHNPEATEPSGSGDVPARNYRLIGALAALCNEIDKSDIQRFADAHGMPGFSPTQGHIASAVPFLGQAVDLLRDGRMNRAMFLAKGSLFLGRMTQMSDGMSFILERNEPRG